MSKTLFEFFALLIFFVLLLYGFIDSLKNNYDINEIDEKSLKSSEIKESVSENNLNQREKIGMEMKKFYETEPSLLQSTNKKYENLIKTLDNYIQRYINLFLITSNLVEYPVKDSNEVINIDLEITLSGEDLVYLQRFSKSGKDSTYSKNLAKLDAIFSKIARLKKKTYLENALNSKSFFTGSAFSVFNNPTFYHFLSFLIIFVVISLIYNFLLRKPYLCLGILINSLIIWDTLNLYWKRIKKEDIDIYVRALQFKEIPADCNPSNLTWYQRLISFTFQSNCLQYFQNINKNPLEEVSLFQCIIDTYGLYFIQTPAKLLGASISNFTGEISKLWPWPLNYFLSVPLVPFFTVIAAFFILILCGKRLRLSFFGSAAEVGDVKHSNVRQICASCCDSAIKGVREVRKLRPWTNVELSKRLGRDFGIRRRLLAKTKYFPQISDVAITNASAFNEKLKIQNPDVKLNDNIMKQD